MGSPFDLAGEARPPRSSAAERTSQPTRIPQASRAARPAPAPRNLGPVPLLGAGDPLPSRPRRLLVAGTSGAGKTTLARAVAEVLGCPHVELDALHHGPGWTKRPEFENDVRRFTSGPAWAAEWQYAAVREVLLDRADCLVWLDLPRAVVMTRVVRRTASRRVRGEVLWNGNTEPPFRAFLTDRDHIVRWAWRTHPHTRKRVLAALAARPELPVVRLRSRREVDEWVARLSPGTASA
jgi:adenylate kinase family enzyme